MNLRTIVGAGLLLSGAMLASAGEKTIVSLRDFSSTELKYAGFETRRPVRVHINALGGGGSTGWTYKNNTMFAYGWIINADTRALVWEMTASNSGRSKDDRSFEGTLDLEAGRYEVYFTAFAFAYHSAFSHISTNVDHRNTPLFGSAGTRKRHFFSWITDWWTKDMGKEWQSRSGSWGIDLSVDASAARDVTSFTPPSAQPDVVLAITALGDNVFERRSFTLSEPATITVRSIGEGQAAAECLDCSWIVNSRTRERVWETSWQSAQPAGGAAKNLLSEADVRLPKGSYTVYAVTDYAHSMADWNGAPPYDPLNWGVTLRIRNPDERRAFSAVPVRDSEQVIVRLTRIRDNESRSEGFTLNQKAELHIYAIGERTNNRRAMADYATIIDTRTRERVWTMDVDRTRHAGGASKNRYVDEVITLPKGSYLVTYSSDDSHAYEEWNDDPPFDQEQYGITITAAGDRSIAGIVGKYVEEKDKNIIAQIVRVGADADRSVRFRLDRTTRIRIYALGEGQGRELFDYGWIEDAKTGTVVWEMTYGMTFHAGGGRKNRMLNTSVVLEKGDYLLRYRSDDSHSYGNWNVDPPDDREYWGITLYRDRLPEAPPLPKPPFPPPLPHSEAPGD